MKFKPQQAYRGLQLLVQVYTLSTVHFTFLKISKWREEVCVGGGGGWVMVRRGVYRMGRGVGKIQILS